MAYTETTSTGFFSRLGHSFAGIGMGIVLLFAALYFKGRAKKAAPAPVAPAE